MTATRADLDELGRLLAEATPGPADPALIVALVNAAAALLAEVAELRETVARVVEAARTAWLEVHGDEADDIESLGLYGVAYREAAADLSAALDGAQ